MVEAGRKERGHLLDHLRSSVAEERERTACFMLDTVLNSNPKATENSEGFMSFLQKLWALIHKPAKTLDNIDLP